MLIFLIVQRGTEADDIGIGIYNYTYCQDHTSTETHHLSRSLWLLVVNFSSTTDLTWLHHDDRQQAEITNVALIIGVGPTGLQC